MKALVVITDGRTDYTRQCAATLPNLGQFDLRVVVDDSGDTRHRAEAAALFDADDVFATGPTPMGGAASVRTAWAWIRNRPEIEWVFHLEDDFTIPSRVDVDRMVRILDENPRVANMVLRRQPWGEEGPGGYLVPRNAGHMLHASFEQRDGWIEHRKGFWLNPCLYHSDVARFHDWPEHADEGQFSERLNDRTFGVYGWRSDEPRCIHIGEQRRAEPVPW